MKQRSLHPKSKKIEGKHPEINAESIKIDARKSNGTNSGKSLQMVSKRKPTQIQKSLQLVRLCGPQ